jgi:hypothetical protein
MFQAFLAHHQESLNCIGSCWCKNCNLKFIYKYVLKVVQHVKVVIRVFNCVPTFCTYLYINFILQFVIPMATYAV